MNSVYFLLNNLLIEILVTPFFWLIMNELLPMDSKGKKISFLLYGFKFIVLNLTILYIKAYYFDSPYLYGIINTISIILLLTVLKILTHMSYLRIIIANFISELLCMFAVIFPYNAALFLAGRNASVSNMLELPLGTHTIVSILIILLLILLALKLVHRWLHNFPNWTIHFQPVWWSLMFLFSFFSYFYYNTTDVFNTASYYVFCASEMLSGMLILYAVSWLIQRRNSQLLQRENQLLTVQNTFMKEYYNTLAYQMDYTRKFHHDISKHMAVLKELTANADVDQRILDYTKELEIAFDQIIPLSYCKNPVYNAILTNKVKQCEEKQIDFQIEMHSFDTGELKEIDMVALLANLLDNAIEACDRLPDTTQKQVQIKSGMQKNNLFIQICNTSQMDSADILTAKTKKPDAYAHGVGTTIIQEIIEKYNGAMTSEFHNDILEILIQFPLEQPAVC